MQLSLTMDAAIIKEFVLDGDYFRQHMYETYAVQVELMIYVDSLFNPNDTIICVTKFKSNDTFFLNE